MHKFEVWNSWILKKICKTYVPVWCTGPWGPQCSRTDTCTRARGCPRDRMRWWRTGQSRRTGWGTSGWCRRCAGGTRCCPGTRGPAPAPGQAWLQHAAWWPVQHSVTAGRQLLYTQQVNRFWHSLDRTLSCFFVFLYTLKHSTNADESTNIENKIHCMISN